MYISPELFVYNELAICTYNSTNNCDNYLWYSTYWCCYYITMAMNVLHNACNMCICDLPCVCHQPSDLQPFSFSSHIRQIPHAYQANLPYPCYNYYLLHLPYNTSAHIRIFTTYNFACL